MLVITTHNKGKPSRNVVQNISLNICGKLRLMQHFFTLRNGSQIIAWFMRKVFLAFQDKKPQLGMPTEDFLMPKGRRKTKGSRSLICGDFLKTVLILIALPGVMMAQGQSVERKNIRAQRLSGQAPRLDGRLTDACWQEEQAWEGPFTQTSPHNGSPSSQPTKLWLYYDDFSLYVGAMLYDSAPDSIQRELALRDETGRNADRFAVAFDPYMSRQNAFYFEVSAAGVQGDRFVTAEDEDINWNAVWKSAVHVHQQGWSVEIEIPWSALRFSKEKEQRWGVNFMREIKRYQERSFWNHVDAEVMGVTTQSGNLNGLRDIRPPIRLQLTPYISTYLLRSPDDESWRTAVNGGADLKYGINESYTLDMSLIPDFGQVLSDNFVLNLSPFEVRFDENRPFFTEGTELFNRGNIFYSRRIGTSFGLTEQPEEGETLISESMPTEAPLINATKVSGRSKNGLGLGFFNALTQETHARVRDDDGHEREILADPLTNFNMLVVDQNLPNNSNISFANTQVWRFHQDARKANVSRASMRMFDKHNTWGMEAVGVLSQVFERNDEGKIAHDVGHSYSLVGGKFSGTWQYEVGQQVESHNYDPNDMGFLGAPNEVNYFTELSYRKLKPFGPFNSFYAEVRSRYSQLYRPRFFTEWSTGVEANVAWAQFLAMRAQCRYAAALGKRFF